MQNSTLEINGMFTEFCHVRSKKPETFRPEEEVMELLKAAMRATGKNKTELLNAAIRHGIGNAVAEFKQLGEQQRAALQKAVAGILSLKEPDDKRGDKPK